MGVRFVGDCRTSREIAAALSEAFGIEEETMSEERCYVILDREGDYWGSQGPSLKKRPGPGERFTRAEAYREKAAFFDEGSDLEPRVVRIVRKPKPKAPREVYIAYCPLFDEQFAYSTKSAAENDKLDHEAAGRPCERVVRYVLAEGERRRADGGEPA